MDQIKEKIEQIAKKLLADKELMSKFEKNPVAVVEEYLGVDLPDDMVKQAVEAIKAKVTVDQVGDLLGGIGKLFGK